MRERREVRQRKEEHREQSRNRAVIEIRAG